MRLDPKQLTQKDNYKLMIGSVLPRPIAFVTSINQEGIVNAAPFSFYTAVSTNPPMIGFTVNRKPGNIQKDTASNIRLNGEFVVHVVDETNVTMVNETATEFPSDVSEVEAAGFTLEPSEVVKVPRIRESKVQLECKLHQIIPMGGTADAPNSDFIVGEIVQFHVQDDLLTDGKINTDQLQPVGRLAGLYYGNIGETYAMPRKSYEAWLEEKE
ncbi:flavin reductase (DIM6/NTAB) family NADH-FMN oxidoreductase RutF [Croceifilum oryzae]|uniref:Flavin reductase (DIM6/NTAB) family NADH-FMN oxidoreductase RutF n=1 Tax=Croceifilum oryzae TaxID=1553429 RepID=A0AAJ1TEL1_9BACL|nr:flavin reductase family protein [Croceifilum oryzae]MDQ0417500.1 flavin reductase (DIM6/NTAB) family NADH-FMN oxidoreductase RutF [Croceifilum oryzae]